VVDGARRWQDAFLTRLGPPKEVFLRVQVLVRHHLAHTHFEGSLRHLRRLTRSLDESGESLSMLARLVEADASGRPPRPRHLPPAMHDMVRLAERLQLMEQGPQPLVLGRHLLARGIAPGRRWAVS
jgi:tRNA nucleotidyltransferase (CCA-adding enzyme)